MKIAIIAHMKYPISQPYHGGLEMHTHILTEELIQRGHDVTLYALENSDPRFTVYQPELRGVTMNQGNDLFDEEPGYNREFVNLFHAYMEVMMHIQRGDYDIVHNNSLHFLPLSMAHTLPCPMVTALHTPPFPSLQSGAILAKPYLGNQFVSVSAHLGEVWSDYVQHYRVVHNGIRIANWTFSERARPKTAVWFGRFCPEKGPEYAIAAARRAGYHLKMAGSIYDQAYFDREIAPLLGEDVEMVGHLNHRQLSDLIGSAEVGLFTSTWDEPFGLVLPEMLACGTPVVAFDSGAASEIITAKCGVIVNKFDTNAMAAALPLAGTLSRTDCRQRAVEAFPISRMIDGYERMYQRLRPGVRRRPAAAAATSATTTSEAMGATSTAAVTVPLAAVATGVA